MLDVIGTNVETNLSAGNMLTMATKYIGAKDHVESIQLEGNGQKINGVYYWIPDATNFQEVQQKLKNELNKNAVQNSKNIQEET